MRKFTSSATSEKVRGGKSRPSTHSKARLSCRSSAPLSGFDERLAVISAVCLKENTVTRSVPCKT